MKETYLILLGATYLFLYYRYSSFERTVKEARKINRDYKGKK